MLCNFCTNECSGRFCSDVCRAEFMFERIKIPNDILLKLLYVHGSIANFSSSFQGIDRTRELARIRDDHTCKVCGEVRLPKDLKRHNKKSLDVHHLNGMCGKKSRKYDRIESLGELLTLCHRCHFNHPEHTFKMPVEN